MAATTASNCRMAGAFLIPLRHCSGPGLWIEQKKRRPAMGPSERSSIFNAP